MVRTICSLVSLLAVACTGETPETPRSVAVPSGIGEAEAVELPSAREALVAVLAVIERANEGEAEIELVSAKCHGLVRPGPTYGTVQIELDLDFIASDSLRAAVHHDALIRQFAEQPWCLESEPTSTIHTERGLRGKKIHVRVTSETVRKLSPLEPPLDPGYRIRSAAVSDAGGIGPLNIQRSTHVVSRELSMKHFKLQPLELIADLQTLLDFLDRVEAEGFTVTAITIPAHKDGGWSYSVELTVAERA